MSERNVRAAIRPWPSVSRPKAAARSSGLIAVEAFKCPALRALDAQQAGHCARVEAEAEKLCCDRIEDAPQRFVKQLRRRK